MDLPRISVLMLTYQHVRYVRESIESILAQDYPNLQIVIGDDASTDGTQDILREYDARYPGLFKLLLAETNQGITQNSTRTFLACDGEFLAHTSGDDVWLPGKLHKQVAWYREHPEAVICYTNAEHIDATGTNVLRLHHEKRRNGFRAGGIDVLLRSTVFFPSCSILVRRSACPPYGFDSRVTWNSDWLYFAEIAMHGTIGYIPEVLVRYRVHSGGAMQKLDRVLSDALLAFGILESKYPQLMPQTQRLRQEFLMGSALQSLKQHDYDTAERHLRIAVRMNPFGDTYLNGPMKAALYLLARTGLLRRAHGIYERFQKQH